MTEIRSVPEIDDNCDVRKKMNHALNCLREGGETDFEKVFETMRELAEAGYHNAQGLLGYLYRKGIGVESSDKEAAKWFKKALRHGNPMVQFCLGEMYESGEGVRRSDKEAARLYALAVKQGVAEAQFRLGTKYEFGEGVEQSVEKAVMLYRLAAEQDHAHAQFNLGMAYHMGMGVEQSLEKAEEWYESAALNGDEMAKKALESLRNSDQSRQLWRNCPNRNDQQ